MIPACELGLGRTLRGHNQNVDIPCHIVRALWKGYLHGVVVPHHTRALVFENPVVNSR